ncbi:MAG: biopolymer transporter ExbD [Saprospiraceae bacterium]|nr:biopolymer transporter ExbD [Saprospiraceae bacterium]
MGIKRRNKTSAEFSMSSLTDIIFLLLIFFMLTSSLVQINIQLPESDSKTVAPTDLSVMIKKDGTYLVNGKKTAKRDLSKRIALEVRYQTNKENATVNIIPESGTEWKETFNVMKIASSLEVKAIISTQPKK